KASEKLRWQIDRLWMSYLGIYFIAAAAVLLHSYREAKRPILRQQLKWLTRGTILAITPFTLFYVIPYLMGILPTTAMKVSVLSLGILPLTFGYAIFRYRLMDVDLIFKRGAAYTLAALAIAGVYFTVIGLVAEVVHTRVPSAGTTGLVLAIVVTALLAEPVRKWIQDRIDRVFYRTRYDYRQTLVEFGRELNAETDLDKMLAAVVDRLTRTLLVDRMAILVAGYLAIAIQNGRLYASLEQKAAQYERLKDFNENIVESINVGVLAVDLNDRIESWNSQMEVMYALPRWQALTRTLSDIFPAEF